MRPPVLRPDRSRRDQDGVWTDYFTIRESARRARILPTMSTLIYGYNGMSPGPTIKVRRGRRAVLRVINELPARHPSLGHDSTTSVHLHGSASLPQFDGYASDITRRGWFKDYEYPNVQPARTLWYHDHGVHHTAQNAYAGLYAQYHMHDRAEQELLPQGEFDVPADDWRRPLHRQRGVDDRRRRIRLVGRRHPRERPTVAGDEGQAQDLPVPFPGGVHLPLLPVPARERRPGHRGRDRRRADAEGTPGEPVAASQRGAVRGADRLPSVSAGSARGAAQPVQRRTTGTSPTPTR